MEVQCSFSKSNLLNADLLMHAAIGDVFTLMFESCYHFVVHCAKLAL